MQWMLKRVVSDDKAWTRSAKWQKEEVCLLTTTAISTMQRGNKR